MYNSLFVSAVWKGLCPLNKMGALRLSILPGLNAMPADWDNYRIQMLFNSPATMYSELVSALEMCICSRIYKQIHKI